LKLDVQRAANSKKHAASGVKFQLFKHLDLPQGSGTPARANLAVFGLLYESLNPGQNGLRRLALVAIATPATANRFVTVAFC
jgi:hypothetical protein